MDLPRREAEINTYCHQDEAHTTDCHHQLLANSLTMSNPADKKIAGKKKLSQPLATTWKVEKYIPRKNFQKVLIKKLTMEHLV